MTTKLLTAKEVSQRINIPLRSTYRLPLKWLRFNSRTVRVLESDLDEFIRTKREAA